MKNEKIIEKLEELVSNLKIQLNTPDPTTFEAEGKYMQLLLNADKIESELSALRSEPGEKMYPEKFIEFLISLGDMEGFCMDNFGDELSAKGVYQYWLNLSTK